MKSIHSLFFILILMFLQCIQLGDLGSPTGSRDVRNHKGTYLKFNLHNSHSKKEENEAPILNRENAYYFIVSWYDPDKPFFWPESDPYTYPINPSELYYINKNDGLYRGRIRQLLGGDRRDFFRFDCEYWMPLPFGENRIMVFLNDYIDKRRENFDVSFQLPENYSIRLKAEPVLIREEKETPLSQAMNPRAGKREFYISERKGFKFDFQIEPNRAGEEEPKCDALNVSSDPSKK